MGKNLLLWLIIGVVLITVFNTFNKRAEPPQLPYSDFMDEVKAGQVESVVFEGQEMIVTRTSNEIYVVVLPSIEDDRLMDTLLEQQVDVEGKMPEEQSFWAQLLIASFPILIIIAVFMLFMRQMQGGMGGRGNPMTFGKSKARLLSEDEIKTTFADVAGVDEAKEDVQELVEFLRDPSKFQRLGGRIPRGTLMVGSPGTGKTLLARAIAGEAKVPFFRSPVPTSWRCSSGWAPRGCATCSSRPRSRPRASSSSTRSTPSDATGARVSVAATMNASRP